MTTEQRAKQSIYSTTKKICREVGANLDVEFEADALALISEMTWKKMSLFALDLDAFQKHAKRSTITSDDVKLLVRRNDSLKELVEHQLKILAANKPQTETINKKKRKAITK